MQLVYFSSSEPAPKNAQTPFYALSKTSGNLAYYPPSPFGEGRGEAFEIPLQIIRRHCSQINPLSLKTGFVTYRESVSYKQTGKRCPFALQNMPFYTSKDALLHCKRASFTTQKGVDGKTKGKEIDKNNPQNTASPSPKVLPPQAPPKEGMCLAGYRMLWVGEIKGKSIKAKSPWVNSQRSKLFEVKICFVTHNSPIC